MTSPRPAPPAEPPAAVVDAFDDWFDESEHNLLVASIDECWRHIAYNAALAAYVAGRNSVVVAGAGGTEAIQAGADAVARMLSRTEPAGQYHRDFANMVLAAATPFMAQGNLPLPEPELAAFVWDYRAQPPLEQMARAIERLSDGRLRMYLPETGTDCYVAILSDGDLDAAEQEATWMEME